MISSNCLILLSIATFSIMAIQAKIDRSQCKCRAAIRPRIVGGHDLAENFFPWYVSIGQLGYNRSFVESDEYKMFGRQYREKEDEEFQLGTHFCGGTILNERFVLTAAHCQTNILSGVGWGSFLPDVFVRGRIRVKRFIIHPKYRPELNAPYDVALVELEEPLPLDDWLQPACVLVQRNDLLLRHHQITAIGHGFTEPLVRLRNEQGSHVELSRRNSFNLKSVFMFRTPDNRAMCQNDVLCVRAMKAGEQVCAGDSGSPVHLDLKGFTLVIGVVSGSSWTLNNWNQIDYTCLESTSVNLVSTHLEFISEHVKDFCKIAF